MKIYVLYLIDGDEISYMYEKCFKDKNKAERTMNKFNKKTTYEWQEWEIEELELDI